VIELKDTKAAADCYSMDIKNLPASLAFREILQDLNFALLYSGTRLARVLILPRVDPIPKTGDRGINPIPFGRWPPGAGDAPFQARAAAKPAGEKNSDVANKLDAIEAMEDSDDPKSIAALGEALTDQNRKVKEAALRALAHKNGSAATDMLRRGLNDADPEFRIEVLESLAEWGDLDSLRKGVADRNRDVREAAADLLANATPQ
jgi:hypothetical protein